MLKWSKIGEGALRCSLNLSPNVLDDSLYVFIIALHPVAFKSVDDSTSALDRILILRSHQEVFDCCTSFEVHLHPMVVTSFLETFTEPSMVWNNDVRFLVGVSSRILKPLVGRSPYHIQNSQDFIQQIQGIQLQPNQLYGVI